MIRRVAFAAIAGAMSVGLFAGTAVAQELEQWLERAANAEYSGRQVTVCETPDGRIGEIVDVAQRDGVLVAATAAGEGMVRAGALYEKSANGSTISTIESVAAWSLADRYEVRVSGPSSVLGRQADVVEVVEGDLVRVRLAFDQATGAVLSSQVNGGDGATYCSSEFSSFRPKANISAADVDDYQEILVTTAAATGRLPDAVAGFARRDLYTGPQNSVAGFYSDGLFSFTIMTADRRIAVQGLEDAPTVEIDGHVYTRQFGPGQVVFAWESKDGGYVVIGDMPPDLAEQVVAELPEPGKSGFFKRVWRRLFGKPS